MVLQCLTETYHLALDIFWSKAGHCAPSVFTPTTVTQGDVYFWTSVHRLENTDAHIQKPSSFFLWINSEVQCTLQGFPGVQVETDLQLKTLALLLLLPKCASQLFAFFSWEFFLDKELESLAQSLLQGVFDWRHLSAYVAEARIWTQGCLTRMLLISMLACGLVWACWWVGSSRYQFYVITFLCTLKICILHPLEK